VQLLGDGKGDVPLHHDRRVTGDLLGLPERYAERARERDGERLARGGRRGDGDDPDVEATLGGGQGVLFSSCSRPAVTPWPSPPASEPLG